MKKNSPSFEEDLKQLEDIVSRMGKVSLPLDESIALFEKGMELSKKCTKRLSQAEKKVQKIINSNKEENVQLENLSIESK